MATKTEMLKELKELGNDEMSEDDSWDDIRLTLSRVKEETESEDLETEEDTESPQIAEDAPDEEIVESEAQAPTDEPTFTVEQLRPFSRSLFDAPPQALVGALSAGFVSEPMTKAEAKEGIRRFQQGG